MKRLALILLLSAGLATSAQAQINAFGLAAAVDGDRILVGQPAPQDASGTIFFYSQAEGEWALTGSLQASDGEPGDFFGYAFTVHGNQLFVGAPSLQPGQGAVYVFERVSADSAWTETAKLTASDSSEMGASLAVSDGLLVTGSMAGSGSVTVFSETEEGWAATGTLSPSEAQDNDRFGTSVATDGESIFVGAAGRNNNDGGIHVFHHDGSAWVESRLLAAPASVSGSFFGGGSIDVSVDGQILVGAPGIIPNVQPTSMPGPGQVIWAGLNADGLDVRQTINASEQAPDFFGLNFVRTHDRLMIGAGVANQGRGHVYVYAPDEATDQWAISDTIRGLDTEQLFGMILDAHGDLAVVSAPASGFGDGSVSVYAVNAETGAWERASTLSSDADAVELLASGAADCEEGIASQFPCSNVDLLAFMPISEYGGGPSTITNDIWGWTNAETGREYALVGRNDGTAFVDITDPSNPVFLGDLPLTEGARPNVWRDMKVFDNHVFIVADNAGEHGMQIFDLMQLVGDLEIPVTFEATAMYDGIASAHNVVINEDTGYAYIVGSSGGGETCGGGLHMVNIQDPANPEFAGCFADTATGRSGTGYSHDAQCVIYNGPDADYTGQEICFNSNETALSISDVTDKDSTVALSNATYPNVAYAHQGWLTDDHAYFYMNDELDEIQGEIVGTRTLIWDVTDLDDPQLVKEHLSENLASDHNLYVKGNLMYQSNYQSGLRILDITDIANPVEVGFLDTVPSGTDSPGFGGSWSNYPYFDSGSIIVTSMNEGLFIVRKRPLDL